MPTGSKSSSSMPLLLLLRCVFFVPLTILILEHVIGIVRVSSSSSFSIPPTINHELSSFSAPKPTTRSNNLRPVPDKPNDRIVTNDNNNKNDMPNDSNPGGGSEQTAPSAPASDVLWTKRDAARDIRMPLDQVVMVASASSSGLEEDCGPEKRLLESHHVPYEQLFPSNRKIPKIVHQTSKDRCLTNKMWNLIQNWRFRDNGWAHYFHTDESIDRLLLQQEWPEFPNLHQVWNCIKDKGTLRADLWRYLVIWEYGGIYADVDTRPNKFDAMTLEDSDDAFFIVEQYHLLSQYFFAASPRHPILFYTIHSTLKTILEAPDVGIINAPRVTGPHALNRGFQLFMADVGTRVPDPVPGQKPAKAGIWKGADGHSLTVRGIGENENEYVNREAIKRHQKEKEYAQMGMSHFTKQSAEKANKSCYRILLEVQKDSEKQIEQRRRRL